MIDQGTNSIFEYKLINVAKLIYSRRMPLFNNMTVVPNKKPQVYKNIIKVHVEETTITDDNIQIIEKIIVYDGMSDSLNNVLLIYKLQEN